MLLLSLFYSNSLGNRIYRKKGPWAEHLTSLPKRGGGALFRLFLHLTAKERPRHVYSDSKPTKQIAHRIMYKGITSGFKVES